MRIEKDMHMPKQCIHIPIICFAAAKVFSMEGILLSKSIFYYYVSWLIRMVVL